MGLCICINYLMPPGLPSRMNRWHLSILLASLHCSVMPVNGHYSYIWYVTGGIPQYKDNYVIRTGISIVFCLPKLVVCYDWSTFGPCMSRVIGHWSTYRSAPGKRPLLGKCRGTSFQRVNVAASIQTYGSYIPGKRPCGPNSQLMFKRPWALTQDTTVVSFSIITIVM